MAVAKDGELCHFDAEQAFLIAGIGEEIYIKILQEDQEFLGTVELLNKAMYGPAQAGRCWFNIFCNDRTGPCSFRKVDDGEMEMVVVVHLDAILAHTKDQATMERFTAELGRKFKLKDMDDDNLLLGGTNPLKHG